MSNQQEMVARSGGGISFGGLLTILFIGLKLGGVIDWSWLWVLSPLWIPLAIIVAILLVIAVVAGIVAGSGGLINVVTRKRDARQRARMSKKRRTR